MHSLGIVTALVVAVFLSACATPTMAPTPEAKAALAPTGKLRVGLYLGNPLSAVRDPSTQEIRGMGVDLGKALAARLGVPYEPVVHESVGALLAGTSANRWDIAILAISADRTKEIDFTTPIVDVELGYLVPAGSALANASEIDRPGVRVAVPARGQADVLLTSILKQATLVPTQGLAAIAGLLKSGKVDATAANKPNLYQLSAELPGSRVLEGRFSVEHVGFALPNGRGTGAAYARQFVEDAKAQGLVKVALERSGARGALVAPPAK